jgi:hypothetical protein
MLTFAHHELLDPAEPADFFSRAGWSLPDAALAVEWALSVFRSGPAGGSIEQHPASAAFVVPDAPLGTYLG